jgi:recombination protein RecA
MAKKKAESSDEAVLNEMAQVEKSITKAYGAGLLVDAQTVLDEPVMTIPLSPALNPVLGGGIPEGSWFILTGPPKFGKTTTLLDFCATCQTEQYGERDVYYLDVEGRLKKMNLTGVKGLRLDKLKIIRSKKGCILSGEAFLDIGLQVLENHPGSILVIDSVSALCGANEMSKDMSEATMGGTSIAQGRFVRKAANIMPINKNIIIGITHQNASLAMFGSPVREKTSNALAYQADVKIKAKKIDAWKVGNKQVGQIVTWNVMVSALGPPGGEVQSYLRYGHGIDKMTELIVMATQLGILSKPEKQQWYTFEYNGEEKKISGLDGVYQFFNEDPSRQQYIQDKINEMLS